MPLQSTGCGEGQPEYTHLPEKRIAVIRPTWITAACLFAGMQPIRKLLPLPGRHHNDRASVDAGKAEDTRCATGTTGTGTTGTGTLHRAANLNLPTTTRQRANHAFRTQSS